MRARNLLIIISDEHRRDAMGCMGHPIVKTPNLDALAARGSVFERAYTASPMCVPTRASLACGDWVHNIRYWDSATPYDGQHQSWMHQLRNSGIDVTSIGKLHFRSGEDDNGFSQEIVRMHVVGGIGWAVGLLRSPPPDYGGAAELAADVGVGERTYTQYDRQITAAAEGWLKARSTQDKPWAAFVSLVSPHYPLTCPKEWSDLYDPAYMDLPLAGDAGPPDHAEVRNVRRFFNYGDYFDAQKTREAKAAYYGLTSFMDDCVGRVLAALEDSGQAEDTVVVYLSDHGDMMGDQGLWTKQVMYEQSAGIPMIIAGQGVPEGRRVKTCANLVDIAATALDVTGVGGAATGESLRSLANAPDDENRTGFSEYHDGGSTTGTFMVRWADWKYVHYVGAEPQLFDLNSDPDELMNLAAIHGTNAQVQAALIEGERRLREICDPEDVNAQAFDDQRRKIDALGGEEACLTAYLFNHTPTPVEQDKMRGGSGA